MDEITFTLDDANIDEKIIYLNTFVNVVQTNMPRRIFEIRTELIKLMAEYDATCAIWEIRDEEASIC